MFGYAVARDDRAFAIFVSHSPIMPNLPLLPSALEQAVTHGVFPGAVLAVRQGIGQADMYTAGLVSTLDAARAVEPATV